MNKILVISGHPDLTSSHCNQLILSQLDSHFEHIDIRRLDTLYPNYDIDIAAEQQALLQADTVVLQFPFYWYAMPALLKKWLDDVFSYGFAYGSSGDKLKGKRLVVSFTIGGPQEAYQPEGYNHYTIEQLITPWRQTANLAGMTLLEPVYSHGMIYIPGVYNTQALVEQRASAHATALIAQLESIKAPQLSQTDKDVQPA